MNIRYENPDEGSLFNTFKGRREAEKSIRMTTMVFLILGGLGLLGTFARQDFISMGIQVVILGIAAWLRASRHMVPAVGLMVISGLDALFATIVVALGGMAIPSLLIWLGLSLVRLWLAVNAFRAARFISKQPPDPNVPAYKI